jgi:hypothetical protein
MADLKPGALPAGRFSLKGIRAESVKLQENEIVVSLRIPERKSPWILRLRGPISFEMKDLVDRALDECTILDMGSFRQLRIHRRSGIAPFRCDYMEGEILPHP